MDYNSGFTFFIVLIFINFFHIYSTASMPLEISRSKRQAPPPIGSGPPSGLGPPSGSPPSGSPPSGSTFPGGLPPTTGGSTIPGSIPPTAPSGFPSTVPSSPQPIPSSTVGIPQTTAPFTGSVPAVLNSAPVAPGAVGSAQINPVKFPDSG